MAKITLAELLKRQMIDNILAEIEGEDLRDLNTSLSNALVRGTGEATAVDKGGWFKLFEQAHPSSGGRTDGNSDRKIDSLPREKRAQSHGLGRLMQKSPKNLIAVEAHKYLVSISLQKSSDLRQNRNSGADILSFPDRRQLPDDTFESLSSKDIERAGLHLVSPDGSDNDQTELQETPLSTTVDANFRPSPIEICVLSEFALSPRSGMRLGENSISTSGKTSAGGAFKIPVNVFFERAGIDAAMSGVTAGDISIMVSENAEGRIKQLRLVASSDSTFVESGEFFLIIEDDLGTQCIARLTPSERTILLQPNQLRGPAVDLRLKCIASHAP